MKRINHTIISTQLAAVLAGPSTLMAADTWQEKVLFNPTPAQIELEEQRHRVMIYEGLTDVQVAKAMEQQFDRIEHMMFTGTVETDGHGNAVIDPETGQAMTEDDGC
jgi:hypothetical protein